LQGTSYRFQKNLATINRLGN